MGQHLVRTEIRKGLRSYEQHRCNEAVQTWMNVLAKLKPGSQKFEVLGYLLRAHEDAGRFKQMLMGSVEQLDMVTEAKSPGQKKKLKKSGNKRPSYVNATEMIRRQRKQKKGKKVTKTMKKKEELYRKQLAVAYLNLARSNAKLSEFHKAVNYSRYCIQTELMGDSERSLQASGTLARTSTLVSPLATSVTPSHHPLHGYAYLTLGQAYFGLGEFPKSLQHYDIALELANARCDSTLALLASIGYGDLFLCLGDTFSALGWYKRAYGHLKTPKISETHNGPELCPVTQAAGRYQRLLNQRVSDCNRKMGRTTEAMELCEEAMRLAIKHGDRSLQGRCLLTFAKIHRVNNDIDRSVPRFECAQSIMAEIGCRLGEAEALRGLARTAAAQRNFRQAIDFNQKALSAGRAIGSKLLMLRCHEDLKSLYEWLNEPEKSQLHGRFAQEFVQEMELMCEVCGEIIGDVRARLDYLSCGHIVHTRCSSHLSRSTLGRNTKKRPCPSCRRKSFLDPMSYG